MRYSVLPNTRVLTYSPDVGSECWPVLSWLYSRIWVLQWLLWQYRARLLLPQGGPSYFGIFVELGFSSSNPHFGIAVWCSFYLSSVFKWSFVELAISYSAKFCCSSPNSFFGISVGGAQVRLLQLLCNPSWFGRSW